MPQLKCDEWPDDGEETTAEREARLASAPVERIRAAGGRRITNDDILEHVVVAVPCISCGDQYGVSLRQITASQQLLHDLEQMWDEGCPNYCRGPVCEPLAYASVVDEANARDAAAAISDAVSRLTHAGADVGIGCSAA